LWQQLPTSAQFSSVFRFCYHDYANLAWAVAELGEKLSRGHDANYTI
jgi:hypothetical protein